MKTRYFLVVTVAECEKSTISVTYEVSCNEVVEKAKELMLKYGNKVHLFTLEFRTCFINCDDVLERKLNRKEEEV